MLRHAHNALQPLTCPTSSKVLTSVTWVCCDNPCILSEGPHAEYGRTVMYNGQVSDRYIQDVMLLCNEHTSCFVMSTQASTNYGDIKQRESVCNICIGSADRLLVRSRRRTTGRCIGNCSRQQSCGGRLCFHGPSAIPCQAENKEGSNYYVAPHMDLYKATYELIAPLFMGNRTYPFVFVQGPSFFRPLGRVAKRGRRLLHRCVCLCAPVTAVYKTKTRELKC